MAQWIEIYEEEQFDEMVQQGPVIALFGAASDMAWNTISGPIRAFVSAPMPLPPFIKVLYVDRDRLPQLAQKRNVRIIPTARFLHDGRQVSELTGEQVTPENIHRNFGKMMQTAQ